MDSIELARWRKARRDELIALRLSIPAEERARVAERGGRGAGPPDPAGPTDHREPVLAIPRGTGPARLDAVAAARGLRIALPVVVEKGQPLVFREWVPGARLTRGVWNIPIPADGPEVTPNVIIAPVVGFDPGTTGWVTAADSLTGRWRR